MKSTLYKKYYPIDDEEKAKAFATRNENEIFSILWWMKKDILRRELNLRENCSGQLKRTVSVFGNVKWGNVLENHATIERIYNGEGAKRISLLKEEYADLYMKHHNHMLSAADVNRLLELSTDRLISNLFLFAVFMIGLIASIALFHYFAR